MNTLNDEFESNDSINLTDSIDLNIKNYTNLVSKTNVVMLAFGIFGNILSIYVLSHKKMLARKFNYYLMILTIFELIFCFLLFIDYLYMIFNSDSVFLHDENMYLSIAFDFSIHTTDSFTQLITLILSIDRNHAIKNPMKHRYFITNTRSKLLVFISLIILILLKIPGIITCHFDYQGKFFIVYCTFINPLIFNIIPTIVILVLNSFLILRIVNYNQNKRSSNLYASQTSDNIKIKVSQSQKSHYFVIMTVAIWTVLTSIPYYALNAYLFLFRIAVFEDLFDPNKIIITQAITSIFFNLNHCINFIIYFSFYKEFRYFTTNRFSKKRTPTFESPSIHSRNRTLSKMYCLKESFV
jgi:hypothetical protein